MKNYFKTLFLFISIFSFSQTQDQKIEYILNLSETIEQYKFYLKEYKIKDLKNQDSIRTENLIKKYNDDEIKRRIIKSFSETYSSENIDKIYEFYKSEAGKNFIKNYSAFSNKIEENFKEIDDEINSLINENSKKSENDIVDKNKPIKVYKEDGFYEVIKFDDITDLKSMKLANKPMITSNQIIEIKRNFDELGIAVIDIKLNKEGTEIFKKMSGQNIGKPIAIVLNKTLISAPYVKEEIPEGRLQISGNFTMEEAEKFIKLKK